MLANSKVMLGAALVCLILSAPLSMLSTGAVEGAVEDNFETFPTDNACADDDCTEADPDWSTSTGERSYYAWNLTNPGAAEPVYEQVGPFDYDITYTREIIDFNETAGTLTYSESKVYTCAEDTRTPCDTEVTTTNIPFQPQVVGATGLVIDNIMTATKAGFTTGMLAQDLESLSVGAPAAGVVATNLSQTAAQLEAVFSMPSEMAAAAAPAALADAYWGGYAANFEAVAGVNYTTANGLHDDFSANFSSDPNPDFDMGYAFYNAVGPGGEDISLTNSLGVTMLSGHCSAFPTEDSATIMADAGNEFVNSGTMQRASLWGYTAMATETMPDFDTTIARDWAMCAGVGASTFAALGGGDSTWMLDTTGTSVDASTRLSYLGITMDNTAAMVMLFGIPGDDVVSGLLEVDGTEFGVANFLTAVPAEDGTIAGLDAATYAAVAAWAGGWMGSTSALPMILLGGSGDMTAEKFVNVTLGGQDPINGGYLEYSMNLGNDDGNRMWGQMPGPYLGAPEVVVSEAAAGNVLYGPLGLTTRTGATLFMYGELMGETPPINFTALATTGVPTAGMPMPWTNATVQALYPGLDANAADALMFMVGEAIYKGTVPDILQNTFLSDGPYKTQTVNQWLFGWFDPVSFAVSSDPTAPSAGWSKLETNLTYYGSGGVSTGPATTYTICTGHNDACDKGETILEDGSNELSWHNTAMATATFGLIGVETLDETTGGFLTGDGDKVDAGGYAITDVTCSGTSEVKNIPVDDCSASVDPTTRPITAKLIKSFSVLDAMTPALPIFFETEITMQAEQLSGLIIAGESTSTFYADTRTAADMLGADGTYEPPQKSDLQPLFRIVQESEIEDDDAEEMESSIVTNQNALTYWTNFDVPTDYIALLLVLGAVSCLILGVIALGKDEE